jgi:RNase P subunit RPR2
MMHCVQCNSELVAPARSEYRSDRHACHIWICPKCSACFGSLVSFPTETDSESVTAILTSDPSLFPALLVA